MHLFQLYHQVSKKKSKEAKPFTPFSEWPSEWKTTFIKKYQRFPLISLPTPMLDTTKQLFPTLLNRRSKREFGNEITMQQLSNLLYFSIGETDKEHKEGVGHRTYQSGGARYPIEFYIIVLKNIEGVTKGAYHYDVDEHGLRKIRNESVSSEEIAEATGYPFVKDAAFGIIFTACFSRMYEKYGEIAYRFVLLEAGGASQNFALVAEALQVDAVSLGGLAEDIVEPLLDIDGTEESCVHSMYFG